MGYRFMLVLFIFIGLTPNQQTLHAETHSIIRLEAPDEDTFIVGAWSPDGEQFATGSVNGHVHLWDTRDGTLRETLMSFDDRRVSAITWVENDTEQLAVGLDTGEVIILDPATGEILLKIEFSEVIHTIIYSPDYTTLYVNYGVSYQRSKLATFDLEKMRVQQEFDVESPGLGSMQMISPNFTLVATPRSLINDLWIIDLQTSDILQKVDLADQDIHTPKQVAWSPDSQYIALGAQEDFSMGSLEGPLIILDAQTRAILYKFPVPIDEDRNRNEHILTVAWSPDSQLVAAGAYDGRVSLWDIDTKEMVMIFEEHETPEINYLQWSPDGMRLASKDDKGIFYLWSIEGES